MHTYGSNYKSLFQPESTINRFIKSGGGAKARESLTSPFSLLVQCVVVAAEIIFSKLYKCLGSIVVLKSTRKYSTQNEILFYDKKVKLTTNEDPKKFIFYRKK